MALACWYILSVLFDWMNPEIRRARARDVAQRRAVYRTELAERAGLLCRLRYPQAKALARLCANVAWDFEIGTGGRPKSLSDDEIARIVKAAYVRA
jgi:transcriptional antiterminator Rof (Rho-off)